MNEPGQSQTDARHRMQALLSTKSVTKIGTWNVRTLFDTSKLRQVLNVMEQYNLDILGISECRWTNSGKTINQGYTILYSGQEHHHVSGVALIVSKKLKKSLIEWHPVSDRIIVARFNSQHAKVTIVQVYAPTNQADDEIKDQFYECLQKTLDGIPRHDVLMVMGDVNAKIGDDNEGIERTIGKQGLGSRNENGDRFVDLCITNDLMIGGTVFQHKEIHKYTWTSPDQATHNQIDHMAINNRWRSTLRDVRSYRGADINSDHSLVIGKFLIKLKAKKKEGDDKPLRFNVLKLKDTGVKQEFQLQIRNRFAELQYLEEEEGVEVENKWSKIKQVFNEVAKETLGYRKANHKEWISHETWSLIEERKSIKAKTLNELDIEQKRILEAEYQRKDREVKRSARRDKRKFLDDLADEAEDAAKKGNSSKVYKITKKLCNKNISTSKPIRGKNGDIITGEKEQAERWTEHFKETLNQPPPTDEITSDLDTNEILDINTDTPSKQEIKDAIRSLKHGKAPGIDCIQAEILQADIDSSADALHGLIKDIWESEILPEDWQKGLIIKLPKKGDLSNCDNWRGITLLSVPGKTLCKVILKRLETVIDLKLREEQAGFRRKRGCIDQIFALRNILEQCAEWNEQIHLNFVDFKKAFDSLHREAIWKILGSYGIPEKLIKIIKIFYLNYECSVVLGEKISNWFSVETGVRQGCILSPLLFLITIDWVMRQTCNIPRGIQWTLYTHLEDLDFADDLALMSRVLNHLKEKTTRLAEIGAKTGLVINTAKTKTMHSNGKPDAPLSIGNQEIDCVDNFNYLGSIISIDNGAEKDIKNRLNKAKGAFALLQPVWRSGKYSKKTKIRLYKSNVLSVLLYGSECWRMTQTDIQKLEVFQNKCLRQICKIFYPEIISNEDLLQLTNVIEVERNIANRRHRLLGHILRMDNQRVPKVALKWTPANGKRNRGRPKTTWRRTMIKDLEKMGLTLKEAEKVAKDRRRWRGLIGPLAPTAET